MRQETGATFHTLQGHKYMSLTTFRKNGQSVPTPVWFAQEGDKLFVMTMPEAGKAKRIRNNAQVEVAPCTVSGEVLGERAEGMARVLPDAENGDAVRLLSRKYGLQRMMFIVMWRLRGISPIYIEISAM